MLEAPLQEVFVEAGCGGGTGVAVLGRRRGHSGRSLSRRRRRIRHLWQGRRHWRKGSEAPWEPCGFELGTVCHHSGMSMVDIEPQ